MAEQKSKLFLDGEQLTLINEDNEEILFDCIAEIYHNEKHFVLLDPVEEMEGIEDDEVIILEMVADEKGEDSFAVVEDDKLLDEIWDLYVKLEDEYAEQHPECDCGCEDDCDCEECNDEKGKCTCGCHEDKE